MALTAYSQGYNTPLTFTDSYIYSVNVVVVRYHILTW